MELPKNITQIGETSPTCKIYAEDYVISYIKQINRSAADKETAVALYGVQKEEGGVTYLFFYGAARLNFLKRECRHLSQAQMQEIEKIRRRYFSGYDFLGYRLLNGEMMEGFHVCQQGVCRYIAGYAQFYEKNDSMLNFMLEERQGAAPPENVDQSKYQEVKRRQEERRSLAEEQPVKRSIYRNGNAGGPGRKNTGSGFHNMQWAAAAAFLLLGVIGVATMNGGSGLEDLRTAARKVLEDMNTQQLPDAMEAVNGSAQVGTVVAEDKLTDAIQKENAAAASSVPGEESPSSDASGTGADSQDAVTQPGQSEAGVPSQEGEDGPDMQGQGSQVTGAGGAEGDGTGNTAQGEQESTASSGQNETTAPESAEEPVSASPAEPVSYTIQKGDTLIGICISRYGSDDRVSEICSFNGIENPDDIKVGQKILLP